MTEILSNFNTNTNFNSNNFNTGLNTNINTNSNNFNTGYTHKEDITTNNSYNANAKTSSEKLYKERLETISYQIENSNRLSLLISKNLEHGQKNI